MDLWQLLLTLALGNVTSFGNGTVMAAVLQRTLVHDAGVLSNEQLLFAIALARVTPGQANLYVASIAYMLFGLPGAALSMVVIALPSYLMLPLLGGYHYLRGSVLVRRFIRGLACTAVGLVVATTINLSKDSLTLPVAWVVLAVALGLMLFTRLPTLVSIVLATGVGMVLVVAVPGLGS